MAFGDQIMYQLYHDLLNDYEADIRPSESYNITLHVTFGFSLAQIIDVVRSRYQSRKKISLTKYNNHS